MASSPLSLPSIRSAQESPSSRLISSPTRNGNEEYRHFSYSNLDPPFGLDFTRDRYDICLGSSEWVDNDDDKILASSHSVESVSSFSRTSTGTISATGYVVASITENIENESLQVSKYHSVLESYRKGGPKEARLKKVALLAKTKEVGHLHPLKVLDIPETIKPDEIASHFGKFGPVEDVYIPTDLKTRKNRDFAIVRYADKRAVTDLVSSGESIRVNDKELRLSPLHKQPSFFTKGTGSHGIANEPTEDDGRSLASRPPPQDVPLSTW